MDEFGMGVRVLRTRRLRMWTQGELAQEAGISPTTVSGIENGKISTPQFGTVRKLARALGVEPEELLSSRAPGGSGRREPLSLEWAMTVREEEFERRLEEASQESLGSLSRELNEEWGRLRRLYGEFPRDSEQRRYVKRQIRDVAAQSGSVDASMTFFRKGPAPWKDGPGGGTS